MRGRPILAAHLHVRALVLPATLRRPCAPPPHLVVRAQGRVIPCEFIGVCRSQQGVHLAGEKVSSHEELMCNYFAQASCMQAWRGWVCGGGLRGVGGRAGGCRGASKRAHVSAAPLTPHPPRSRPSCRTA